MKDFVVTMQAMLVKEFTVQAEGASEAVSLASKQFDQHNLDASYTVAKTFPVAATIADKQSGKLAQKELQEKYVQGFVRSCPYDPNVHLNILDELVGTGNLGLLRITECPKCHRRFHETHACILVEEAPNEEL